MKKISIILACAAVALGFTSCEQDTDPKLQTPTTFVLNNPVFGTQLYELVNGNTFSIEASQPDYGYSAIVQYSAEASLTEDFRESVALPNINPTQSIITVKDNELAVAMCVLHGFENLGEYTAWAADNGGVESVYLRAVAELDGVEGSLIKSNVVKLDNVKFYYAEKVPGFIYLVGAPEGWAGPTEDNAAHYEPWKLSEAPDAIESKIYSNTFEIGAGADAMFRFYTALTGWDADSYGSQADDNPIEYEIVDGSFAGTVVKGKGSYSFPAWEGGKMNIVVDMSDSKNMTLTITAE